MNPVRRVLALDSTRLARALAAAALVAGAARAQSLMHETTGAAALELRGYSVAGLGDVDGDGKSDYAVGSPWDDGSAPDAGAVRIFSGASGAPIRTFWGQSSGDGFGYAVGNAGDVNNDGTPDLIVGAPKALKLGGTRPGKAYVFEPKTGATLSSWYGDSDQDQFGFSVAGGIDPDQNGYADLLVGAPRDDDGGLDAGSVRAFSGVSGSVFNTFHGDDAGDLFGYSTAVIGDATGDGLPDFAVGAKDAAIYPLGRPGLVKVLDGSTGLVAWTLAGVANGSEMGYAVAGGLDMNLDGRADVVVSMPGYSGNGGRVQIRSGANGNLLAERYSVLGDQLGASVAVLDDVDGDGRKDYAIGAPESAPGEPGYVEVRSGANNGLIFQLYGEQGGEHFGHSVAKVADANGDGQCDLVVGAIYYDAGGNDDAGAARLFSRQSLQPVAYCTGKTNSVGCVPWIGWNGTPKETGGLPFEIYAANVLNQRPGVLIYGMDSSAVPFQGGILCVRTPVTRMPVGWSGGSPTGTDCSGILGFDFESRILSGVDPRLDAGRTVYAQIWYRDGAASFGTGLSNAVRFTIAP
jgi:hypothetical protein